ncbi:MAG: DoxX family membrane protein [bacterium]|nr:DoxX family membrane protein [bacterium]
MLSLFPVLLSYNLAVPTVFRIIVGLTFIFFSYQNANEQKAAKIALFEKTGSTFPSVWLWTLIAIEMVGGSMLIVGLWTQAASLALSLILLFGIAIKQKDATSLPWSKGFLALLFLITLSLMFLGSGFYGLDLPL